MAASTTDASSFAWNGRKILPAVYVSSPVVPESEAKTAHDKDHQEWVEDRTFPQTETVLEPAGPAGTEALFRFESEGKITCCVMSCLKDIASPDTVFRLIVRTSQEWDTENRKLHVWGTFCSIKCRDWFSLTTRWVQPCAKTINSIVDKCVFAGDTETSQVINDFVYSRQAVAETLSIVSQDISHAFSPVEIAMDMMFKSAWRQRTQAVVSSKGTSKCTNCPRTFVWDPFWMPVHKNTSLNVWVFWRQFPTDKDPAPFCGPSCVKSFSLHHTWIHGNEVVQECHRYFRKEHNIQCLLEAPPAECLSLFSPNGMKMKQFNEAPFRYSVVNLLVPPMTMTKMELGRSKPHLFTRDIVNSLDILFSSLHPDQPTAAQVDAIVQRTLAGNGTRPSLDSSSSSSGPVEMVIESSDERTPSPPVRDDDSDEDDDEDHETMTAGTFMRSNTLRSHLPEWHPPHM
jgi:hypothetical protein